MIGKLLLASFTKIEIWQSEEIKVSTNSHALVQTLADKILPEYHEIKYVIKYGNFQETQSR